MVESEDEQIDTCQQKKKLDTIPEVEETEFSFGQLDDMVDEALTDKEKQLLSEFVTRDNLKAQFDKAERKIFNVDYSKPNPD